ncbi:MAG TPA: carboxypeptidase-like regulatory domain-containing protein, partial [Terriglobales bacterium]
MSANATYRRSLSFIVFTLLAATLSYAQFTGNIQGTVQDPSGAGIPKATVTLVNQANEVTSTTTTDTGGNYRFVSLAPGPYKLTVEASGFRKTEYPITLQTNQTLEVPVSLKVGAVTEAVTVSAEAPLVNTAETRTQLTLETPALSTLPLAGRSFTSLVTLAPGVSGLGVVGGGTPGSGVDNYSTETQVDVSANGQGTVANKFIVDGLNVTSAIRQGVLNLTPNPDLIQETNVQVNTFSVEYGGASSIQMTSTTKSGADQFHGLASDYFTYQNAYATFSLPNSAKK